MHLKSLCALWPPKLQAPQSQQCKVQTADVGPCSSILTISSMNWQEHNPNSPPHLTKSMEREADNKDRLGKDNKEKIIQLQNTQSWKRPTGSSPTPAGPWIQSPAGNKSKHWSLLGWRRGLCYQDSDQRTIWAEKIWTHCPTSSSSSVGWEEMILSKAVPYFRGELWWT